jgi:hypothetical protein
VSWGPNYIFTTTFSVVRTTQISLNLVEKVEGRIIGMYKSANFHCTHRRGTVFLNARGAAV